MYEMGEQLERVILAGVQTYESDDTVQSLYELRELAETAGAVTVGTIMQSRETIHPADVYKRQSNGLLSRGSGVRIPPSTFLFSKEERYGGYSAVG